VLAKLHPYTSARQVNHRTALHRSGSIDQRNELPVPRTYADPYG